MTRPSPRPLATVRRLPTAAEETQAMLPVRDLIAMQATVSAAAVLVREIRNRRARQEHRVPDREYKALAARLEALGELLKEDK